MLFQRLISFDLSMGREVKDPRVTTGAGTALSGRVAELTAASEAEAKTIVGAGGLPCGLWEGDRQVDGAAAEQRGEMGVDLTNALSLLRSIAENGLSRV